MRYHAKDSRGNGGHDVCVLREDCRCGCAVCARIREMEPSAVNVLAERQKEYADPRTNFRRIAALWSVILGGEVRPEDVALCMIALKITREMHRHKADNLDDIVGYAECLRTITEGKSECL